MEQRRSEGKAGRAGAWKTLPRPCDSSRQDAPEGLPEGGCGYGAPVPDGQHGARGGLIALALAYNAAHHLGLLPGGLGDAGGGTRWGDWLELLVPYAVLVPALAVLASTGATRREWVLALAGAAAYAQGTGVHLSANSIGNALGGAAPVHLWDEVVGHAVWYAGFALLVLALAGALSRTDLRAGPVALLLALLTGTTWATNALGADGLALPGLLVALALAACGWRLRRSGAGRLLLAAYVPSAAGLAVALALS